MCLWKYGIRCPQTSCSAKLFLWYGQCSVFIFLGYCDLQSGLFHKINTISFSVHWLILGLAWVWTLVILLTLAYLAFAAPIHPVHGCSKINQCPQDQSVLLTLADLRYQSMADWSKINQCRLTMADLALDLVCPQQPDVGDLFLQENTANYVVCGALSAKTKGFWICCSENV